MGAAEDHVLDLGRIDSGASDRVADRVAAELGPVGHVERAAPGLAQGRAGGGYDHCVGHEVSPGN
jgi:hypothetical protein